MSNDTRGTFLRLFFWMRHCGTILKNVSIFPSRQCAYPKCSRRSVRLTAPLKDIPSLRVVWVLLMRYADKLVMDS